jgi:hypothetical protein
LLQARNLLSSRREEEAKAAADWEEVARVAADWGAAGLGAAGLGAAVTAAGLEEGAWVAAG